MKNELATELKKLKNKNLNVKFPESDYLELQKIAEQLGGLTLSSMMRMLVYSKLELVKKTGNPHDFIKP